MTGSRAFLLCSHDAGGTIPPMLALARELVGRGHEVVWLAQPSVRGRALTAGCRFVPFEGLGDYAADLPIEEQPELALALMTGTAVGDQLYAECATGDIDGVVVDCNLASAAAAAETLDIVSAVLLHSMYRTFVDVWLGEWWPLLAPGIAAARDHYGLPTAESWADVFAGHDRLISVVPSSFEAPVDAIPTNLRHFGFLVADGACDADAIPTGVEPLVLVGLSTTSMGEQTLLARIVDALATLPVRAIVTTTEHLAADTSRPPNVTLYERLDHGAVLEQADLMVTHAGLGSVANALTHGVALVCTPCTRDQPLNAERVANARAGVVLDPAASSEEIASAINRVLGDEQYRRAAAVVATESRAAGGARAAVDDLESLLG